MLKELVAYLAVEKDVYILSSEDRVSWLGVVVLMMEIVLCSSVYGCVPDAGYIHGVVD
jgi:hypothetical protein